MQVHSIQPENSRACTIRIRSCGPSPSKYVSRHSQSMEDFASHEAKGHLARRTYSRFDPVGRRPGRGITRDAMCLCEISSGLGRGKARFPENVKVIARHSGSPRLSRLHATFVFRVTILERTSKGLVSRGASLMRQASGGAPKCLLRGGNVDKSIFVSSAVRLIRVHSYST